MRSVRKLRAWSACAVASAVLVLGGAGEAGARGGKPAVPDLTAGGTKDKGHDWNLGPTGARGWMWGWKLATTDSRQILVTKIAKGSPADGVLAVGDVILGAAGRPFTEDARVGLARAIAGAETDAKGGRLKLTCWRRGARREVEVRLKVMGSYSETAPYDCPKTKAIVDGAYGFLRRKGIGGGIPGNLNALGLLATGRPEFLTIIKEHAHKVGRPDIKCPVDKHGGMVAWSWGYTGLFLTEYYLATRDAYVLPAIRELAVGIARGQSGVGTWGHGMAWMALNEGRLHGALGGYGAMNQSGLVCYMTLVLARKCGVYHKEIDDAIERGDRFFRFYIGKGAIPYGDHRPWAGSHDNNGKSGSAAVAYDLLGNKPGAAFFAKMAVAAYDEREAGHTGNFFSFLWGPLGAARSGPEAYAAHMKELRWFFDLERRWDGSFGYQGGAGSAGGEHKYGSWDCTGARLLAYCVPGRRLYLTGKGTGAAERLTGLKLREVMDAGRGYTYWDAVSYYNKKSVDELFTCLRNWSPPVRHRASKALASKQGDFVPRLLEMLGDADLTARYGACLALENMKGKAAAAVPALTKLLSHSDVWLRIRAAYALAGIGGPARTAVPQLLRLAVRKDRNDPREFTQRYLCFALFYPGGALRMTGLIARSLDGVDKKLLYPAIRKLLTNDDGRARGCVSSVYKLLSYEELAPLWPDIMRSIVVSAPSGVMFASGIRLRGVELLAKHRVREGLPLCLEIMDIERWGKRHRIGTCLKILGSYGGAVRQVLPELKDLERKLVRHREAKGLKAFIDQVRKIIADAEAATDEPELRSIGRYLR